MSYKGSKTSSLDVKERKARKAAREAAKAATGPSKASPWNKRNSPVPGTGSNGKAFHHLPKAKI